MGPERYRRVEELFEALRERTVEEREAELTRHCGDDREVHDLVRSLLDHHDRARSFLSGSPRIPSSLSEWLPELTRAPIGGYELVKPISSGGMGVVYEAVQHQPHRAVALKLLRLSVAGEVGAARFRNEIEVLGRLRHPNIAQIHEAGVHVEAGFEVPYFAMELVTGALPLTEYAEHHGLDTKERIRLFLQVCDAVHHGHLHGVIHRDLKPANVLVDEAGMAKVIDFGIARITDSDLALTTLATASGELLGTVHYMSPEQCDIEGDELDLRTDVYSLGVVLYELLTRELPYGLPSTSALAAAMAIRDREPIAPSSRREALRGDLDAIVLQALAKERHQRYQSVAELAADLGRWLRREPVRARTPSPWQSLGAWVRRRRALAAALVVSFLALGASTLLATLGLVEARERMEQAEDARGLAEGEWARADGERVRAETARELAEEARERAERERQRAESEKLEAEREREESEAVTRFFESALLAADSDLPSGRQDVSVRDVLDQAEPWLESGFVDKPLVEARLRGVIGGTYLGLGEYAAAERHLQRSIELSDETPGADAATIEMRRVWLARVLLMKGDAARAAEQLDPVIARCRRDLEDDTLDYAHAVFQRGQAAMALGALDEALDWLYEAEDVFLGHEGEGDDDGAAAVGLPSCFAAQASVLHLQGDREAALDLLAEAYERRVEATSANDRQAMSMQAQLGAWWMGMGDLDLAESLLRESLQRMEAVLGSDHHDLCLPLGTLAQVSMDRWRPQEGIPLLERCLGLFRKHGVGGHNLVRTLHSLAVAQVATQQWSAAESTYREALDVIEQDFDSAHPLRGEILASFAHSLTLQGEEEVALPMIDQAVEILQRALGPLHPRTRSALETRDGLRAQRDDRND